MDFRFSRRVSILPGLKLNLSGSGVSLSAGVRGAHINLGPRGLYGSAGIQGTGLSCRPRLDSSSRSCDRPSVERRLSTRQWEAMQWRQEQEEKAKETDPIDTYVLDLEFAREDLKSFNPETTPMQPFLVHSGARFQMAADYQLARIEPPSWLKHDNVKNAPVQ